MAQPSKSHTNVILLVETSPATLPRWPDVRQHYLPLLLEALEGRSAYDHVRLFFVHVVHLDCRHSFIIFTAIRSYLDSSR